MIWKRAATWDRFIGFARLQDSLVLEARHAFASCSRV